MVVSVREFLFVTVGSVVLSLVVLGVLWPWARQVRRLAVIGVAMAVGIVIWNLHPALGEGRGGERRERQSACGRGPTR